MHQNGWMMARLDSIYLSISNNEAMWRPHETMKWPNGGTIMYRQNKTVIIHFVASRYVVSHSLFRTHQVWTVVKTISHDILKIPWHWWWEYCCFHGNWEHGSNEKHHSKNYLQLHLSLIINSSLMMHCICISAS